MDTCTNHCHCHCHGDQLYGAYTDLYMRDLELTALNAIIDRAMNDGIIPGPVMRPAKPPSRMSRILPIAWNVFLWAVGLYIVGVFLWAALSPRFS